MTTSTKSNSDLLAIIDDYIDYHDGIIKETFKMKNLKPDQHMIEMKKLIGQCREMDLRINTMVLENNKKYAQLVQLYIAAVQERVSPSLIS